MVDQTAVLSWGVPRLRDLPWRHTRDPWAILVSEVMLQQTQASRVIPKWETFLAAWPSPSTCSEAALGDVLRVWQGLGYPRRARNLHAAAGELVRLDGFPRTLDGLLALPGVGQYTARALLAFAFELPAAVVDTNIARVLARVTGHALTARQAQSTADSWLDDEEPWVWNQVLMDLGATICRPTPLCPSCPLQHVCVWNGSEAGTPDPAIGSAGVSVRQSRFVGSDRQARGRLLHRLALGPIPQAAAADVMVVEPLRATRLTSDLIADGLVVNESGQLRLP